MPYGVPILIEGDVVQTLQGLDSDSADACLCDPPYFLEFMGKSFDRQHKSMPGDNDGQRMYAWHLEWCREVYRVLKPGAFIMSFGGTRTIHRLTCALEDVGFEVRDNLCWLFGQGFPKSHDISKSIDRLLGNEREQVKPRSVINHQRQLVNTRPYMSDPDHTTVSDIPASDDSSAWTGYGTALKPAHEPIILAMKPLDGTFAQNALVHGVAGLNIDGGRIGTDLSAPTQSVGRWPSNLILSHHPSCQEIGTRCVKTDSHYPASRPSGSHAGESTGYVGQSNLTELKPKTERVSAYNCHPLCPVRLLDEQSGSSKSPNKPVKQGGYHGGGYDVGKDRGTLRETYGIGYGDSGGPSRFFYTSKVSTRERNLGDIDCKHPTLKPISLCQYFATLLLPPSRSDTPRALLVPFSGAGSEVIGSLLAGWDEVIGIEFDPQYVEWAEARIRAATSEIGSPLSPKPGIPPSRQSAHGKYTPDPDYLNSL